MSLCSSVRSKSTAQVYGRARRLGPAFLSFVLVAGAAFDNVGYNASTWGWLTLVPLVLVGAALVLNRARRPDRLALGFLASWPPSRHGPGFRSRGPTTFR